MKRLHMETLKLREFMGYFSVSNENKGKLEELLNMTYDNSPQLGETEITVFCKKKEKASIIINAADKNDKDKTRLLAVVFDYAAKKVIDCKIFKRLCDYTAVQDFIDPYYGDIIVNEIHEEVHKRFTEDLFWLSGEKILLRNTDEVLFDLSCGDSGAEQVDAAAIIEEILADDDIVKIDGAELQQKDKNRRYENYVWILKEELDKKFAGFKLKEVYKYLYDIELIFRDEQKRYVIRPTDKSVKNRLNKVDDVRESLVGINKSIYSSLKGGNNNE